MILDKETKVDISEILIDKEMLDEVKKLPEQERSRQLGEIKKLPQRNEIYGAADAYLYDEGWCKDQGIYDDVGKVDEYHGLIRICLYNQMKKLKLIKTSNKNQN